MCTYVLVKNVKNKKELVNWFISPWKKPPPSPPPSRTCHHIMCTCVHTHVQNKVSYPNMLGPRGVQLSEMFG